MTTTTLPSSAARASLMEALCRLPKDFDFGVATASYQIEGAHDADGKGEGTWDRFCERPDAIWRGHSGRVACDHYNRLDEDLDLLKALGVDSYRFSISWPRLLPSGTGKSNEAGIAFYNRLIDGLLLRGIRPVATLFHWDACQALEDKGGFASAAMPGWFADYTRLIARSFGDRVKHFLTINEPHAFTEGGLLEGRHAPGKELSLSSVLKASHNTLLAHGEAVRVLRAEIPGVWVAAAPALIAAIPFSESEADVEAARKATFALRDGKIRSTGFWLDPLFGKGYPEDVLRHFGGHMPQFTSAEMDSIAAPLDACGVNIYDAALTRATDDGGSEFVVPKAGSPMTAFNWPVTPSALYWGPRYLHERYGKPVVITENGLSNRDWVNEDGEVQDGARIDFLRRHLREVCRATDEGIAITGYYHWSLLDNFEWNHGYREQFGLVHVDLESQTRTPKASFHEYAALLKAVGDQRA